MQDLLKWTLGIIRENDDMLWLEERKFEWAPLLCSPLNALLSGAAIIIVTDSNRDWFADYCIRFVNDVSKNRPFIPVYKLSALFPNIDAFKNDNLGRFKDLSDTLDVTFNQYIFWYIGRSNEPILDFVKKREDGLFWIFDEESSDNFMLRSFDKRLDAKLLSMCSLLDKTIFAALFGEVLLKA
jgi:hypothetical protein